MEFFFSLQHRDWGGGFAAEDEASLWKRVSSNHALNALSLARQVDSELKKTGGSSPLFRYFNCFGDCRSITKEEKEKENTRKVAPQSTAALPPAGRPSSVQARPMNNVFTEDLKAVCIHSFINFKRGAVLIMNPQAKTDFDKKCH